MWRSIFVLVTTLSVTSCQKKPSTYSVVASTVIRPNTDHLVAVAVFNIGLEQRKSNYAIFFGGPML
jgi:uncharacterized lipoprotein YajG